MTDRTAAHYWREIDEAWNTAITENPDDPSGGEKVQGLIFEAILAGVSAHHVDVGDGASVPLHELLAPLRARPGGLAETNAAESRRVLDASMAQRRVWWK